MSKQTGIDALNAHLFEAIEGLKNNRDPRADEQECMDIDTAKAIADIAKVVIDGYKVKANVLQMYSKADSPNDFRKAVVSAGFISDAKELPE